MVDAVVNLRLLMSMIMPILMSVLFGSLFGGLQDGSVPASIASAPGPPIVVPVYDAGESQIVYLLQASESFEVRPVASSEEMQQVLTREGLSVGLILPQGFDMALVEGTQPVLQLMVHHRPEDDSAAVWQRTHQEALRAWLTRTLWDRTDQPFPSVVTAEALALPEEGSLNQRQENMALWLVMSLVTTGVYVVPTLLIEEKQSHTLNAVLVTPAGYGDLVLAKAIVGLVYALLAGGLILGLNDGLVANAGLVIGAVFVGALVLVQVGLLLGGLFDDTATFNTWSTLIMLALMLPGVVHSLSASGLFRLDSVQWIVRLLPTQYVLEVVYAALSNQLAPKHVGAQVGLLGGAAILFFFATVVALRRRER